MYSTYGTSNLHFPSSLILVTLLIDGLCDGRWSRNTLINILFDDTTPTDFVSNPSIAPLTLFQYSIHALKMAINLQRITYESATATNTSATTTHSHTCTDSSSPPPPH